MKFIFITLLSMFLFGCNDEVADTDTTTEPDDSTTQEVDDDDMMTGENDIVASSLDMIVSQIECTSGDSSLLFESKVGSFNCSNEVINSYGESPSQTCTCEFTVDGSVLGYSINENSTWCQDLTRSVLNNAAITFPSQRVYDSHTGMTCAIVESEEATSS